MDNFDNFLDEDADVRWGELLNNYAKLKYIESNKNNESNDFINHFLKQIDKKTQIYLSEISWNSDGNTLYYDIKRIEKYLEQSLQENSIDKKIKILLDAYKLIVQIVEILRNEEIVHLEVDDDDFLDFFNGK
jgi:hypothetical protein